MVLYDWTTAAQANDLFRSITCRILRHIQAPHSWARTRPSAPPKSSKGVEVCRLTSMDTMSSANNTAGHKCPNNNEYPPTHLRRFLTIVDRDTLMSIARHLGITYCTWPRTNGRTTVRFTNRIKLAKARKFANKLTLALLAFAVLAFATANAYATPDKGADCTKCHSGSPPTKSNAK
jgi:hypothetical protein